LSISIPLAAIYGGTGQNSFATGDTLYASAPNILSKRTIGDEGDVLTVIGGVPVWQNPFAIQTGPETPNTQPNGDDYEFLPVTVDGNARYIPLTHTPALNWQNDGLNLICMGTNVCGGVSGVARTTLQNLAEQSTVIGKDACGNWNVANTQTLSVIVMGEGAARNLGAGQSMNSSIFIGTSAGEGATSTQTCDGTILIGTNNSKQYRPSSSNVYIGDSLCENRPTNSFDNSQVKLGSAIQQNATQPGGKGQVLIGANIMNAATCSFEEDNNSIMIGYGIAATASGQLGPSNVFMGGNCLANCTFTALDSGYNVIAGGDTLSGAGTSIRSYNVCIGAGTLTGAGAGLGTDSVVIGAESFTANVAPLADNIVCIGSSQSGVPAASEVMIGQGCVASGVAGRLSFGNAMEAIAATATAGAAVLPATPAGFLVISWNGTLYKIPVYNN
jgi:hypothetical protein